MSRLPHYLGVFLCLVLAIQPLAKASPPKSPPPKPTPINRARAAGGLVGTALEHLHLRARRLSESLSREAFNLFIDAFDPQKAIFLESDVEALRRRHAASMAPAILRGNFSLATDTATRFKVRIEELLPHVRSQHKLKWQRSGEGTFESDPVRRSFPRSMAEQRQLWTTLMRIAWFEALLRTDSKTPATDQETQLRVISDTVRLLSQHASLTLAKAAIWQINAVASSFDPHTALLPPKELEEFQAMAEQQMDGVGLVLSHGDPYPRVAHVVPGSPSWIQGDIRTGDTLIAVTDENGIYRNTANDSLRQATRRLNGPFGSTVRLLIEQHDGGRQRIVLTRGAVDSPTGRAQGAVIRLPGSPSRLYGLITLPMFYRQLDDGPERSAALDVRRLLSQLNLCNVDGLILDLRGNTGGVLEEAVAVAGLFLDGGPIVQLERYRDTPRVLEDPSEVEDYTGPLAVLIDRGSASASEIVAAALQDYKRAIIIGSTSYGKGTAQMLMPLDPLLDDRRKGLRPIGALKITRSQFYRVSGQSTQRHGVTPDILLPAPFVPSTVGESRSPKALQHNTTTSLIWTVRWRPELSPVVQKSRQRIARSESFKPLIAEASVRSRLRTDTRQPIGFTQWKRRIQHARVQLANAQGPRPRPRLVSISPVQSPGDDEDPEPQAIFEARQVWSDTLSKDPWIAESLVILENLTDL